MHSKIIMPICLLLISLLGCGQQPQKGSQDTVQSIHATCNVVNNMNTVIICVDYSQDIPESADSCAYEESRYADMGANNHNYYPTAGTNNTTGCYMVNPTYNLVGTCLLIGADVRYYTNDWSLNSAQKDCLNRNGNWQL